MPVITLRIPRLPYGILGLSIALHIGLLCLIGGWIISRPAESRQAPESFVEKITPVIDEWDAPTPELETLPPEPLDESTSTLPPLPATNLPSGANSTTPASFCSMAPATIGIAGNLLPESKSSGGTGANGNSKGLAGKINVGTLFNTRVESSRLGVLLDVSSSAHSYLPLVVSEIEHNFNDTVIVLTYGCGIYEKSTADSMYLKELNRCKPDSLGAKNTLGQIAKAANANGEVGNLIKKLQTRKEIYVLYAEDCGHTYYGFKKLIDAKVDTIYWFADFRDKISGRMANRLITELNQNGIKVIAHNFSGKPVPEEGEKIAGETHGATISKIPGGKEK